MSSDSVGPRIPVRRRVLEIIAVILTALGKFVFMDFLDWKLPFILFVMAGWLVYVIYMKQRTSRVFKSWGFRTDNARQVTRKLLPLSLTAFVVFVFIGYVQGTINLSWHIIPVLVLYPAWGIVQQFLVIAMVGGNLKAINPGNRQRIVNITVTALLFGVIHYPYFWLMGGTFILGIVYGSIYFHSPNILVLGVFHGWLGALFFYTIVNRDPFIEIFGAVVRP
jgi:uncharacterized protein